MKTRLISALGALLVCLGLVVVTAAPAQAWSYCQNNPLTSGLTLYRYQGYCTELEYWNAEFVGINVCRQVTGPSDNSAGAAYNPSNYGVILYNTTMCDSVNGTWKWMAKHTSDPDLYNDGMYHTVSSFMFIIG